jgi:hypothetical protein
LTAAATGAALGGAEATPLSLTVVAAAVAPAECTAAVLLHAADVSGEAGGRNGVVVAGQSLQVGVTPYDAFGNVVSGVRPQRITVSLSGPMEVTLAPTDDAIADEVFYDCNEPTQNNGKAHGNKATPASLRFAGVAARAGGYVLRIAVDGVAVGGWTRPVHVVPGPVSASQCTLAAPASLTCGRPAPLCLSALDSFGNACASGGANVTVTVAAADQVCG